MARAVNRMEKLIHLGQLLLNGAPRNWPERYAFALDKASQAGVPEDYAVKAILAAEPNIKA